VSHKSSLHSGERTTHNPCLIAETDALLFLKAGASMGFKAKPMDFISISAITMNGKLRIR
jgi:hypothetical protein